MTPRAEQGPSPLAFDPDAEVYVESHPCATMEAVLERHAHGLVLKLIDEAGDERVLAYLRADFLSEFVAQARASSQSAA